MKIDAMEQTRVKKYKDYRNSLGKTDDQVLNTTLDKKSDNEELIETPTPRVPRTTTTVSYDQIMEATNYSQKEDDLIAELKKKRMVNTILICVGILLLISVIVVSGILIFR